ncbi:CheR family methyltransferase [Halomonas vilamensis]|uniref:CheR family methyltransferase n=1 Tax=Vreelandella vilamensis TaxID=531309 RepID=A0ABU1H2G7_9GAMM|nr:CheR family methyltransferase [Halomonas vilamensis]MDR5898492.1 CheR family methyltransferase [Halomonas vilamensis]
MSDELWPFKDLIKNHCGLLLEGIAEDRLHKTLQMAARVEGKSLKALLPVLQKNKELVKDLVDQLTVNETYFFRENAQIELLTHQLLPRLRKLQGKNRPLKILSAGCSSGEEPYSVVIALEEAWGANAAKLFQVEGGDLDRQILHKARKGAYSPFSFRGVPEALRLRYFETVGSYFQLKPEWRHRVAFHELNLLDAYYPPALKDLDVVFFRNVSIYFDIETRLKIQKKLAEILKPDGFLIVGSSETLANDLGVFTLVEEQGLYYFVKGKALLPVSHSTLMPGKAEKRDAITRSTPMPARPTVVPLKQPLREVKSTTVLAQSFCIKDIVQLMLNQENSLASKQLEYLLAADKNLREARLLKAWLLGNRKEFDAALTLLKEQLHEEPWWLDALVLQGLLYKWQVQLEDAEKAFRKAVYIKPNCWPAHYYLAEIYRQTEQDALALRTYKSAWRCLQGQAVASTGLELLPLHLPRSDLLFLIEHQLIRLKQKLVVSEQGRK